VHSEYDRWSVHAALGWTPDDRTIVEFTAERSDAEAAYDDRGMDGVIFDRTGYTLSMSRADMAPWLSNVEALLFYNYVDHVMDNYSLRTFTPSASMPFKSVSNPDRRTSGGRVALELAWREGDALTVGRGHGPTHHFHAQDKGNKA
jgi:iron complex outermembrane receptor protein